MIFSIELDEKKLNEYIEKTILSVLEQNYKDLEYILVDAGSTDGSREIIEKYRNKISKIIYQSDKGPADGLNKGFAYATGEIFGFLNSDDELLPNSLNIIGGYLKANPQIDIVSGCGYFIDSNGMRIKRIVPSHLTPWLYIHGAVSVFQQGTFFRANSFKKAIGFNIHNKTCWDGELFLDMAILGARHSTIADDIANFRLHSEGITGSGRLLNSYQKDSLRLFYKVARRERIMIWDQISDFLAKTIKYSSGHSYPFQYALIALNKRK